MSNFGTVTIVTLSKYEVLCHFMDVKTAPKESAFAEGAPVAGNSRPPPVHFTFLLPPVEKLWVGRRADTMIACPNSWNPHSLEFA